jgi:hypothetical protein
LIEQQKRATIPCYVVSLLLAPGKATVIAESTRFPTQLSPRFRSAGRIREPGDRSALVGLLSRLDQTGNLVEMCVASAFRERGGLPDCAGRLS